MRRAIFRKLNSPPKLCCAVSLLHGNRITSYTTIDMSLIILADRLIKLFMFEMSPNLASFLVCYIDNYHWFLYTVYFRFWDVNFLLKCTLYFGTHSIGFHTHVFFQKDTEMLPACIWCFTLEKKRLLYCWRHSKGHFWDRPGHFYI